MENLNQVIEAIVQFTRDRNWEQFHSSKDLALAISIESSELTELFLWKGNEEVNKERLSDELADVLMFSILLAQKHDLDLLSIIKQKIEKNQLKYPINKSMGSSKKYNEL